MTGLSTLAVAAVWANLGSSQLWFALLIGAVAGERILELLLSRRHRLRIEAQGGFQVRERVYPLMVALHTGVLVAAPAEVILARRPLVPLLTAIMLTLVVLSMGLRYWVISTLGERWSTRILVLPGAPLVESGPFRWLRHPNYLAVCIELVALPMVHTAWLTALTASAANLLVLRVRIRTEERALLGAGDEDPVPPGSAFSSDS